MIDEYSLDRTGWARFSDDETKRYRLGRILNPGLVAVGWSDLHRASLDRTVFVMVNPSTANAFKPDNTITKCCQFAQRWGSDVVEAVNLFSHRSPYPRDLLAVSPRYTEEDDRAILDACTQLGRTIVIAAWGNHGELDRRGEYVRGMLRAKGIPLYHLGLTSGGNPLHPLARGKAFIPLDREPKEWT